LPVADDNAKELCRREERLFDKKANLDALNQEIALNFRPQRADFTVERALGEEFALDLMDSEPIRCCRELGDARAAMLRPGGREWFRAKLNDQQMNGDPAIKGLLDQMNEIARTAIYDPSTGFVRAEKEADHDMVTFGNAVKSVETTIDRKGRRHMLERTWHQRDCAWLDDETGVRQDFMARRFKASARHIKKQFPKAELHSSIVRALDKTPDQEFKLCHVMMLAEEYEGYKDQHPKQPWVSLYYDSEHKMMLSERPSERFRYIVDRWETIPGSQYGYSPAAMTALPDGRGIQTMARVLLEAGEKALDPPLKASRKGITGEIRTGAAQITWIDGTGYDERVMGPAIEPLFPDGFKPALGIDLINRTTLALRDTWYLTKLTLPTQAKTAYETAQLVEEFIRANIPLFEPWEAGMAVLLDEIFAVLIEMHAFGHPLELARSPLSGRDLVFAFQNPLQDAIEKNKVNQAQQALGIVAGAMQIDPNAAHAVDAVKIVRSAVQGTGAPADWTPDEDVTGQKIAAAQQGAGIVNALNTAGQAADVVNTGAEAAAKLQQVRQGANDGSGAYGPV